MLQNIAEHEGAQSQHHAVPSPSIKSIIQPKIKSVPQYIQTATI